MAISRQLPLPGLPYEVVGSSFDPALTRQQETFGIHPAHGSDGQEGWPRPRMNQCLTDDKHFSRAEFELVGSESNPMSVNKMLLEQLRWNGSNIRG